ncbi:hypothetical protein ALO61_200151 [Pseudomonas savastanoi pv. nerii]|nr:hypothetical protein ALO61_200151 [Pseudomonas savastanoi pv. nerii]KPY76029.1 hypothetical protein ALO58_200145 [Pseudomonas savastanoi pv. savastanoi]KUG42149.1 hypothetical protein ALP79_200418 [Pseudomonas savastanoi pv. fraxini]RML72590.1 hypothetical protein ALQ90_200284 [Pseudomonas savastanoi pv. savastanoi]RMN63363.1 hypothetical protein ALQ55_200114 [Pseudomonas savastanoi pv. savastanoi]
MRSVDYAPFKVFYEPSEMETYTKLAAGSSDTI